MKFRFCPDEKCTHWSNNTKYPRKCYYEVQCWRGKLDTIIAIFSRSKNPFELEVEEA